MGKIYGVFLKLLASEGLIHQLFIYPCINICKSAFKEILHISTPNK